MAEEVVQLENICKSYGIGSTVETEVLHDVNLVLGRGGFYALMGPSGSGKSTLLNIIGLLDRPTRGKRIISGTDTGPLSDDAMTRLRGHAIGFVFQYHHLLSAFSALENVMLPMLLANGRPNDAMRVSAEHLLDRVGLSPWRNQRATNMSGGQQQRVAIARALALNPALVLADEPTGNLDSKSADGVFHLMREVNAASGTTFLMVTHNRALADRCDRIIELVDGRLVN